MANPSLQRGFSLPIITLTIGATILFTLVLIAISALAASPPSADTEGAEMSLALIIHLATVIPAIPLGAVVLFRRKGDAMHKLLGKLWATLMLITAVATIWLRDFGGGLFGTGMSFIHLFTFLTLFSIPYAIWQVRRGNIAEHYRAMQGPYIGLIIAGLFAFLPGRLLGGLVF